MLNIILTIIIILIVTLVGNVEWKRHKFNKIFRHISGPKQYPIIGNLFAIKANDIRNVKNIANELVFEPVVKIVFFDKMMLLVADPYVLEQILGSPVFTDRVQFLTDFWKWNEALAIAQYPVWKILRKISRQSFNHSRTIATIPIIQKHVGRYDALIGKYVDTNIAFDFMDISLEVSLCQGLETVLDCTEKPTLLGHHLFETIAETYADRAIKPYFYSNWIYKCTNSYNRSKRAYKILETILKKIINEARENHDSPNVPGSSLIELLLKAKEESKITEKQLLQTAGLFLNNNYETTALITAYTILMLAMYPDIDEKIQIELRKYWKPGNPIDYNLIKNLSYLEMVIKESLRLFPIPILMRCNRKEIHIDGLGNVPKNTIIIPVFYKLHRWKHIWGPDAEEFNPDHFLPEVEQKRHPFSFLPFSAGPRMCMGYEYAMLSLKLSLAQILSKYRFETDIKYEDLKFKLTLTLKCLNKHLVRAYVRKMVD